MNGLVVASAYGPIGASTRVRVYDWLDHLGWRDVQRHEFRGAAHNRPGELLRHPMETLEAMRRTHAIDVFGRPLVVSREASPFGRGRLEERLLHQAAHGVFDFDDALFDDTSRFRQVLGGAEKTVRSVQAADVVIAGNDYLADWASARNSQVRVIPSCIDPDAYRVKTTWEVSRPPRIIWVGSPGTEGYLAQIAPALRRVGQTTGAILVVVSGSATNPALADLDFMLRRVPWQPGLAERELADADVAIAPLDDSPYARGKCAYKVLQYAAAGLPVVGSPVGANRLALQRFGGVSVEGLDDWRDALVSVLAEPVRVRQARGHTARSGVVAHYSFQAWAPAWVDAVGQSTSAD